jgi:hypothetical protein
MSAALAAVIAVAVALIFLSKELLLGRYPEWVQKRVLIIVRGCIITAAVYLGTYYGVQFKGSSDFPIANVRPLAIGVSIICTLIVFYALWTLILLKPEQGLLFKGNVYSIFDQNTLSDLTDMELEFTKATKLMLSREYQEINVILLEASRDKQEFLFLAARLLLDQMQRRSEMDVHIQGEVFYPDAINEETLAEVPRPFRGIVHKALRTDKGIDVDHGDHTGVAYTVQLDDCRVVTLLWSNKSITAVRVAQFWACFVEFLNNLPGSYAGDDLSDVGG